MEIENVLDDNNMWGAINDFVEWSLEPSAAPIFIILLLVERVVREWIASRTAKRLTQQAHHHNHPDG